jgi:YegS/Rv2252/BmrU family lipid kinase
MTEIAPHQARPASGAAPVRTDVPYRRALIVANPIAGNGKGASVAGELGEALKRLGASTRVHVTRAAGDAWHWLRSEGAGADLVVAVGGDGTLREVLGGLVDPEVPVGVLPMGTANALAAELGLPRDVDRALEVLARGRTTRLDVATVNDSLSFLVTGVGFDARTVREVEARRDGPITKLAYGPAVLRALRGYRPPSLSVEIDGRARSERFGLVLASNIGHYGGFLRLASGSRLDDGRFDVYLFPEAGAAGLAAHALRGMLGRLVGRSCEMVPARRLRVTSDDPVPFQVDGDYGGVTPVELSVSDTQYRVLIP